jgi:hypothetical protein
LYNVPGFVPSRTHWSLFGGTGGSDCGLNNTVGINIQAIAVVITIRGRCERLEYDPVNRRLNYTANQGLSKLHLVPQTTSNVIYFSLPTALAANLIFDVVGYFAVSDATALQCTIQASAAPTIGASGGTGGATSASY